MTPKPVPEDLRELAAAHGVVTSYRNERREPVEVDADVVIRVLGLLDVDARTEADRRRELARLAERERAGSVGADYRRASRWADPSRCAGPRLLVS